MSAAKVGHKYIIVGGGTAGCVLANRLSADKVIYLFYIHMRLQAVGFRGEWYSSSSVRVPKVLTLCYLQIRYTGICNLNGDARSSSMIRHSYAIKWFWHLLPPNQILVDRAASFIHDVASSCYQILMLG